MPSECGGLEVDGTSVEKSGFAAGSFVDNADVFQGSIVEKSNPCALV